MPYIELNITKNLDDNLKIWRYIDFTKFVDLLERKKQYFVSGEKLQNTIDPFEGFFQKSNLLNQEQLDEFDKQMITQRDTQARFEDPKSVFVNCWQINDVDSHAMWKIFTTVNTGIAIQTTVKQLKKSFHYYHRPVYISKIKYGDNKHKDTTISWIPHRFSRKGKSFIHEQELRIFTEGTDITSECFASDDGINYKFYTIPPYNHIVEKDDDGIYVNIDPDYFIEKIYVAPLAEEWFFDLVKKITKRYGLHQPVEKSSLLNKPS